MELIGKKFFLELEEKNKRNGKMSKIYSKVERQKELLKFFLRKMGDCYFCGGNIDWKSLYPKKYGYKKMDDITIHHLDLNHWNDDIENQELCHRKCHRKFHQRLDDWELLEGIHGCIPSLEEKREYGKLLCKKFEV